MSGGWYADGTSGWSGGQSSRDRARREDTTGVTGRRQQQVLTLLRAAGHEGMTVREVERALVLGHGAASGALTRLHRAGHVQRLAEQRHRQEVYVLAQWVYDRETVPYRPNSRRYSEAEREHVTQLETRLVELSAQVRRVRALADSGRAFITPDELLAALRPVDPPD